MPYFYKAMEDLIRNEVDIFVGVRPPPEYAEHTKKLLQFTLLRDEHLRGRTAEECPKNLEYKKDAAQRLCDMCSRVVIRSWS